MTTRLRCRNIRSKDGMAPRDEYQATLVRSLENKLTGDVLLKVTGIYTANRFAKWLLDRIEPDHLNKILTMTVAEGRVDVFIDSTLSQTERQPLIDWFKSFPLIQFSRERVAYMDPPSPVIHEYKTQLTYQVQGQGGEISVMFNVWTGESGEAS